MTRDFLHVDDVTDLYLLMGMHLANNPSIRGEIFNAGPNDPVSVKEILEMIFLIGNNNEDYQDILNQMKDKKPSGEIDYQCMDFEKVNNYFNWSPSINLDKRNENTFDWFKDYLSK